ncbi:MAG: DnaA regulatory inactivator Hda [Kangiellaceae bacterium]|nr:DnaA regulatory inactivator Hda [Kangiellaceae bacterium]
MQQIPLHIELKEDATFDNYIVGDNDILLAQLQAIAPLQQEFIYLYGDSGSGRSHLLQALAQQYSEHYPQSLIAYLPLDNTMLVPQMLDGLSEFDCVCLDGFEAVTGDQEWETAIFNLYNSFKDGGKSLVITGLEAPAYLKTYLPDLKSRLSAMFIHAIKPLSDQDKLQFLSNKAQQRGLELSEDVAQFLLSRQQRDLPSLNHLLERLDHASLQAKRRLTIPFVKQVLDA